MNKKYISCTIMPIFLVFTLFLTGCTAAFSNRSSSTDTMLSETTGYVSRDMLDNSRSYDQNSYMAEYYGSEETEAAYSDSEASSGDQGVVAGNPALTEDDMASADAQTDTDTTTERKLIRTVNVSLETTDFDGLINDISERTEALGGYLESSYVYNGDNHSDRLRSASYTARIPRERLDEFLNSAFTNGVMISRDENVEDVTLTYTDLEARVYTLETERTRLMELLANAQDVDAIIALESQLSEVRYELESIKSSLRVYDNQVDYSYVYINISEVEVTSVANPYSFSGRIVSGFQQNLLRLLDTLTDLLIWFITNLPAIVVVILVIYVIYRLGKFIFHGKKKKGKKEKSEIKNARSISQKIISKDDISPGEQNIPNENGDEK